MAKEKFGILFMAGGALLNVMGTRLRREPANARESIGAAMHQLNESLAAHRDELDEPDAVAAQVAAIRAELCADRPHRLVLTTHIQELASLVFAVDDLALATAHLHDAVVDWLG